MDETQNTENARGLDENGMPPNSATPDEVDHADDPKATTTHAEPGTGHPRLLVHSERERFVHELGLDDLVIGSSDGSGLQLADVDPVHATITHDERDEYVLAMHGAGEMNTTGPDNEPAASAPHTEVLRTGSRFTAGPWTFVFQRDEFADHGLPFGGHEGGEGSPQPVQPEPESYDRSGDSRPEVADGDGNSAPNGAATGTQAEREALPRDDRRTNEATPSA